jgi:hypothetical protein
MFTGKHHDIQIHYIQLSITQSALKEIPRKHQALVILFFLTL